MNNRSIVLGALAVCVFVGCGGGDNKGSQGDAGPDAGEIGGSGGRSTAGHGGAGGAAGGGGGSYAVHGKVTGLTGSGLVLQDNGGDDLEIKADGDFVFATML